MRMQMMNERTRDWRDLGLVPVPRDGFALKNVIVEKCDV